MSSPWPKLAPVLAAALLAAAMLWLAGDPFRLPEPGADGAGLPTVALLAPDGPQAAFPARFEWGPVVGADRYRITVRRLRPEEATLFRQYGETTRLDLDWEPGQAPPDGEYSWEVVAERLERPLATGSARFTVGRPETTPAP
ncbi:MAG: hypothetical protein KC591_05470 [Gemmatimonadetes bacterium]|nr:hypothetical protein [Gemmatimonadota bacterium]